MILAKKVSGKYNMNKIKKGGENRCQYKCKSYGTEFVVSEVKPLECYTIKAVTAKCRVS